MKIKNGQVYGFALATSKNGEYEVASIVKVENLAIGPKLLFENKKIKMYFCLFYKCDTLPTYLKFRYMVWLDDNYEVIKYTPFGHTFDVPAKTTLTLDYKCELGNGNFF